MKDRYTVLIVVVLFTVLGIISMPSSEITGAVTTEISVSMTIAAPSCPIPTGDDVEYNNCMGQGADITFDQVTGAGELTVTKTAGNPTGQTPSGFRAVGQFWEITTTATYTPPITICVSGFDVKPGHKLFHWENVGGVDRWIDITTLVDTVGDVLCGQTNILSPFGVFTPSAAAPSAGRGYGGGGSGYDPRYSSAYTVHGVEEVEEEPKKVSIKQVPKEEPVEEAGVGGEEAAKPAAVPEEMPVVKMPEPPKDQSLYVLLGVIGFVVVMILISYIFFKIEHNR
ncbi:hypothetical protein KY335_01940 [Candidatus Woesearchaeota archaeon]|nr:hypothetical protein [Candidatus Woesearchaeota archaeon]